jgi:hypothetical protein
VRGCIGDDRSLNEIEAAPTGEERGREEIGTMGGGWIRVDGVLP